MADRGLALAAAARARTRKSKSKSKSSSSKRSEHSRKSKKKFQFSASAAEFVPGAPFVPHPPPPRASLVPHPPPPRASLVPHPPPPRVPAPAPVVPALPPRPRLTRAHSLVAHMSRFPNHKSMSEDPRLSPHIRNVYPLTGKVGPHRTRKATLGEGSFGRVNLESYPEGNVATKYFTSADTICENVTEIGALKYLRGLPNVAQLVRVEHRAVKRGDPNLNFPAAIMGKARAALTDRKLYTSWDDVFDVVKQVLLGYEVLHANRLAHRDTKPGNMLMTAVGEVWITDFGMTRYIPPHSEMPSDAYTGTMPYAAPELLMARAMRKLVPFDFFKSDAWAVGASLYEIITGQRVFDGDDEDEIMARIVTVMGTPKPSDGVVRELFNYFKLRDTFLANVGPATLAITDRLAKPFGGSGGIDSRIMARAAFKPADPDTLKQISEIVVGLCTFNPEKRMTIAEALAHPVFGGAPSPLPPVKTITDQYMKHVPLSPDINARMLDILFDWLYEIAFKNKFNPFVIDRMGVYIMAFLNENPDLLRQKLQLVGVTAMYLADCLFGDGFMDFDDAADITANAYTPQQVKACVREFILADINLFGRTFFDELLEHMSDKSKIQTLAYLNYVCFQKYLFPRNTKDLPRLRDHVLKFAAHMNVPFLKEVIKPTEDGKGYQPTGLVARREPKTPSFIAEARALF